MRWSKLLRLIPASRHTSFLLRWTSCHPMSGTPSHPQWPCTEQRSDLAVTHCHTAVTVLHIPLDHDVQVYWALTG